MARRTRPGNPLVAVAYIRASKEEQRISPEAQRASIEAWAAREGIHIAAWHVDAGVCSVTPIGGRPALCAALASLRENGAGVLAVAKRDRVARDVVLAALVERATTAAGARLVSAAGEGNGDTPADQFMRTVVDGASQYERGLIRARTKAALAVKKARGERVGGVPYGFAATPDGHLVENHEERRVVAEVRALRTAGSTVRQIVAALTEKGYRSRKGTPLGLAQVHALVHAA